MVAVADKLTKKDFQTDQEVRWCPGCGDYAILAAVQRVLPRLGVPKEKTVFVSGIGCSSRFPYYMNTYGFHTIHGRAPAIATGVKMANPDLSVWVVTGDGDGLSIGTNHLLHALRRNVNLKILLFNNQIYGLTKGQLSPTSEKGKLTKSTPFGSIEEPFLPLSLALSANAGFVARAIDRDPKRLENILERAAAHQGTAFVEIYQNCNVFNDGAFDTFTDKSLRSHRQIWLEHGQPLTFDDGKKGLSFAGPPHFEPQIVDAEGANLPVHDERDAPPAWAQMLATLPQDRYPVVLGVFRAQERPTYESEVLAQNDRARAKPGPSSIGELLRTGDTWTVGPDGSR